MNPLFIVSACRSGSTAAAHIFQTAINAQAHVEQPPKLLLEQRLMYDGLLGEPEIERILATKKEQIDHVHTEDRIYIDKNSNYMLFCDLLVERLEGNIVFLVRDGRDVVRSFMDWTKLMGKNLYRRSEDGVHCPDIAPDENPWDYSFPRPRPGNIYHSNWKPLSPFEKFTWYWAEVNRLMLKMMEQIPENRQVLLNMNSLTPCQIEEVFTRFGLKGFERNRIENLIRARINSVQSRMGLEDEFPHYSQWPDSLMQQFVRIGGDMMRAYGYL